MDVYYERMINDVPTKTSKSDTTITLYGYNILKKVTEKVWVKNKLKSSILQYKEKCLWLRERYWIFTKRSRCCQWGLNNLRRLIEKIGENDKIFKWDKEKLPYPEC